MARWKLMTAHYLNCPGTEWEYNETSRSNGKSVRRRFPVPRYLNPQDPGDWNNRWGNKDNEEGEVIVYQGQGNPNDIEFTGDPTPDMMPLDDEAKGISAGFTDRWRYKPEETDISFSQSLVDKFEEQMVDIKTKPAQIEGLADLVTAVAAMAKANQELITAMAERRKL